VLAARELIAKVGGFDETIRSAKLRFVQAALVSDVALLDETTRAMRRHEAKL